MHDSDAYRRLGIVEANGEEFIVPVVNDGKFAESAFAILVPDAVIEHPRVTCPDLGFGGRFETQAEARKTSWFQEESSRRQTVWPAEYR